jgi:hypothetical protein
LDLSILVAGPMIVSEQKLVAEQSGQKLRLVVA